MSLYRPTPDERDTLKNAVSKFAHEPAKTHLLSCLDLPDFDYPHGSDDWNKLKLCVEHQHMHAQTEVRRDPNKKANRLLMTKADALVRKFHPNFS
jgi:hypothetical protein